MNISSDSSRSDGPIKRRGLLALAAAAVAGLVAKLSEQPVLAGSDGDVILGASGTANVTATVTAICNNGFAAGPAILGFRSSGAVASVPTSINAGVAAECFESSGVGLYAICQNGTQARGAHGISSQGYGVLGETSQGVGVQGTVQASSSSNAIAVYGLNNSSFPGPGAGAGGFGVYGLSAKGHGLVGATAAPGAAAVVGATNGVVGAYGAAFYGPVIVGGAFTVVNGPKSAAVPHPDGSHRRLYCMESPESWFEDVGEAHLTCGQVEVPLDPEFSELIAADHYHVFLTEYGGHNDLSVAERTPRGFRVEAKNPESEARFSWRVMAKRKDIAGPRLEHVTVPPEPLLPGIPDRDSRARQD